MIRLNRVVWGRENEDKKKTKKTRGITKTHLLHAFPFILIIMFSTKMHFINNKKRATYTQQKSYKLSEGNRAKPTGE